MTNKKTQTKESQAGRYGQERASRREHHTHSRKDIVPHRMSALTREKKAASVGLAAQE